MAGNAKMTANFYGRNLNEAKCLEDCCNMTKQKLANKTSGFNQDKRINKHSWIRISCCCGEDLDALNICRIKYNYNITKYTNLTK